MGRYSVGRPITTPLIRKKTYKNPKQKSRNYHIYGTHYFSRKNRPSFHSKWQASKAHTTRAAYRYSFILYIVLYFTCEPFLQSHLSKSPPRLGQIPASDLGVTSIIYIRLYHCNDTTPRNTPKTYLCEVLHAPA